MKKTVLLLTFCCCSMIYGQQSIHIEDRWDTYTNPNTDNYYYHHFKKYITDDLISKKLFPKETSKIILEFNLDSVYNVFNIRTNANVKNLKEAILKGFQEIDFQKMVIKSSSPLLNYSIQLLAIENGEAVLKTSSTVLHEYPPIMEGCEKNSNYKDYQKCFISNLEYLIETSFDSTMVEEIDLEKELKIYSKINFNKTGKLEILNVKSEDSLLVQGTTEALKKFNFRFRPATLNGVKDNYAVDLVIKSENIGPSKNDIFENASSENELSKHFKNEIPLELINLANFSLKRNNVTLTFYINKNNQFENIKTNASDETLDEAIIEAFKKFPVEKLHISDKNPLNLYGFQVITSGNHANIIKCSEPFIFETLPLIKGCEKSESAVILKKCNQDAITNYVNSNFDTNAAKNINKTGVMRIFAIFKINKLGEISDIRVRAPHKDLEIETIRVLKKIRVSKPGYQRGKPVNVKYSLPIAFKIPEKREVQFQNQDKKTFSRFRY